MVESLVTFDSFLGAKKIYPGISTSDISVNYNPYSTGWNDKKLSVFEVVKEIYNVNDAIFLLNALIKPVWKDGYCSASLTDILNLSNWDTSKPQNYERMWNLLKIFGSFTVIYSENPKFYNMSPLILLIDRKYSANKNIPTFISWTMGGWLKSSYFKNLIVYNKK
jgi:hypothetical protein